jgi:hypothetical protein
VFLYIVAKDSQFLAVVLGKGAELEEERVKDWGSLRNERRAALSPRRKGVLFILNKAASIDSSGSIAIRASLKSYIDIVLLPIF